MSEAKQYLNRFSEPTFTRFFKCEGCGGRTRIKLIETECGQCRGDGYLESDDWMWHPQGWENCYQCDGRGSYKMWEKYCCSECKEQSYMEWLEEENMKSWQDNQKHYA